MNAKDRRRKKKLRSKCRHSDAKLTLEVEDSEGDVSVLLLRDFLFIARAQALSN